MMKSEVRAKAMPKSHQFPTLMRLTGHADVVLFTSEQKGTIVNGDFYALGYYCDSWHVRFFEPFDGEVVLSS